MNWLKFRLEEKNIIYSTSISNHPVLLFFLRLTMSFFSESFILEDKWSLQYLLSHSIYSICFQYADNYYRAALVDALAATITPAVTMVTITG